MNSKYTDYANKVLSGEIVACRYVRLACERYLEWLQRKDIEFKPEKVDKVVNFVGKLKHFTGSLNGKFFVLSEFQYWIICNIFGFYRNGYRVVRNVYIELARKNGKSFFAAAISLYCLIADNEHNAEIELVANSAKQAKIIFEMCRNLVQGLDKKNKYFSTYRDSIKFAHTKSLLQILSSEAGNNDGWNSSLFIVDEYHSAQSSAMYDVMKSSQGNRDNPLAIVITTAGFNLFSPCYQMRKTNIEILEKVKEDDTVFAAIYTLDESDDWQNEQNFIKANPNLDVSVKSQYLKEQVQQAKNNSSLEVATRTKNLNQWLASTDIWLTNDLILQNTQKIDLNSFKGERAYIGIDLASVSDLTAVSIMIPYKEKYYFKTFYYLPSSTLQNNSNSERYKQWKRKKQLNITSGNVTDYDFVLRDIQKLGEKVYIEQIGYDSYNATQFAINATSVGLPLVPFGQSIGNFNKPTKELERLLKSGKVVVDDNEITRWCFSNVTLKTDHNDNIKPVKTQEQQKIDGVIAMIEALGIYLDIPHYDNSISIV